MKLCTWKMYGFVCHGPQFCLSIQKIPLNFIKHTIQPWIDDLSKPKTIIINIEFITMIINHLDFFGNHNSIESIHSDNMNVNVKNIKPHSSFRNRRHCLQKIDLSDTTR